MLCAENGMFSLSDRKVDYYITRLLHPESIAQDDTGPRGFIGVIGPVGALEGCIMLTVGSVWYSDDWTLDEHINFVDPAYRNSNHAKDLIEYAKNCADRIGIPLVIGVLSTERTAAKVRLYGRYLTPAGAFFVNGVRVKDVSPTIKVRDDIYIRTVINKRNQNRPMKHIRDRLKLGIVS